MARAIELTGGQPWLVNALGYEIVDRMAVAPDETITIDHIEEAKERLILARATHLDSLVARLMETRVKPVIETVSVENCSSTSACPRIRIMMSPVLGKTERRNLTQMRGFARLVRES